MSNKPGFFRQLKDTQNYSTKFLIVLFSPNSGVTPNREVELMEFYGLMPTHDDTPAPAPYSSPKLQDYGLVPPSNAEQIIIEIEHGEKNATGKRENNQRYTRY